MLRKSFDEALGVTGTCPENSLLYVALGAALYADKEFVLSDVAAALDEYAATATYASEPPLFASKEEYEAFHAALASAERAPLHAFDAGAEQGAQPDPDAHGKKADTVTVYEGCMPIEIMAARGADTMRFGPLRPVGLIDPRTGHRPWANVQLRAENKERTLYNIVGFQTNLKWGEQKRVFSMIPGLENAEFVRYGVMHRNTYLDSPRLLDRYYRLKSQSRIAFAGQMTGVEGYMESAASGILAGKNLARRLQGKAPLILPRETMMGALAAYISSAPTENFQPMGANMGILPDLPERIRGKQEKYQAYADPVSYTHLTLPTIA